MATTERKIAAVFPDRQSAEAARRQLLETSGMPAENCEILPPGQDLDLARRARYSRRTRGSLVMWHLLLGAAGACAGLLVAAGLMAWQPELMSAGRVLVFTVAGVFGAIFGLLMAGAIALRPDEGFLFSAVKDRLREGDWAVVAFARDEAEYRKAEDALFRHAEHRYAAL